MTTTTATTTATTVLASYYYEDLKLLHHSDRVISYELTSLRRSMPSRFFSHKAQAVRAWQQAEDEARSWKLAGDLYMKSLEKEA